ITAARSTVRVTKDSEVRITPTAPRGAVGDFLYAPQRQQRGAFAALIPYRYSAVTHGMIRETARERNRSHTTWPRFFCRSARRRSHRRGRARRGLSRSARGFRRALGASVSRSIDQRRDPGVVFTAFRTARDR